jgi:hypothetical protein
MAIVAQAKIEGGRFQVAGAIDTWVTLDSALPIVLHGFYLAGMVIAAADEDSEHRLDFRLVNPAGAPVALPPSFDGRKVQLDPQSDGAFAGAFFIPLDGIRLSERGEHRFMLQIDGTEAGAAPLNVVHWPHRARLVLKHLLQDQQGVTVHEHYLSGRIVADVIAEGRTRENLIIGVKQSSGSQSLRDPFEIRLPEGYRDLASAPEFRPAVESFYRERTIGTPDVGMAINVSATNNLMLGPPVIVDLTLANESRHAW